ncbi:opioid growth factor receptor-related protein [Vibrio campbellii]|uniref:opioid growth factor receptor-related protein n=1 Tax=Vibrio campbellii TaxID=680 RepID=UPI000CD33DB2|nr:hypothetical protein C1N51_28140 [Vibrio campbellii]
MGDTWLDTDQEYIQWLFPVDTITINDNNAPIVSVDDYNLFSSNRRLQSVHRESLDRMLKYFGLIRLCNSLAPIERLDTRNYDWISSSSKNHSRITRILRSLYVLGQENLAKSMCSELIRIAQTNGEVPDVIFSYWKSSVADYSDNIYACTG